GHPFAGFQITIMLFMKRLAPFLCVLVSLCCGVVDSTLAAESSPASAGVQSSTRKISIDPVTGRKTSPSIAVPGPTIHPTNQLSTSSAGLIETPVTEKPGGFKVHLDGRFHATLLVTNHPNGKAATQCISGPAPNASANAQPPAI